MLAKVIQYQHVFFIITLEVVFALIKNKVDIKGIDLYDHTFLFTALVETLKEFSCISGLKPNIAKCKLAGLGPLKVALEAVFGLKTGLRIGLTNDAIKILGIHFLCHNETKKLQNFLSTVIKIQIALNVWNTRTFTLEGRILISKTLGISKIIYLSLVTTVPNSILNEILKNLESFFMVLYKT